MNTVRSKVILSYSSTWDEFKLALTADQINLLKWLMDNDVIDCEWKMQVLEAETVWKEI